MTQAKPAPLFTPERVPHGILRKGETYLKQRLFALEDASVQRLARLYTSAYRAIADSGTRHAEALGLRKLDSSLATASWRASFLADAGVHLTVLRQGVRQDIDRATHAALAGGYYGHLWLLDTATKADVRVNTPPLSSSLLREDVYDDLIQKLLGRDWREQYELELDDLTTQIRRAIGQGTINGEGIPDVMDRVAQAMGVQMRSIPLSSGRHLGWGANFNRIQAITRTVINRLSNDGALSAYRANDDILAGYQWLTANDERVCSICEGMNNNFYKFNSDVRPPAHPNCRCTVIPIVKPGLLEAPTAMPRANFRKWSQGFGMDKALADFLVPQGA